MTVATRRGFVLVALAVVGACSSPRSMEDPLVINTSSPDAARLRQSARQANARVVAEFNASNTEVWGIPRTEMPAFMARSRTMSSDAFEVLTAEAPSLVPSESVALERLTAAQQAALEPLLTGVAAGAFRITEPRPTEVGRYFLGVSAATGSASLATWRGTLGQRLSLELLGQRRIVFQQTSVERRTDDDLTWRGTVEGGGAVTLTVLPTGITGSVVLPDATFLLSPGPDNLQVIRQQGPERPDHPEPPEPGTGRGRGARGRGRLERGDATIFGVEENIAKMVAESAPPIGASCPADQGETIDVFFVVTPKVAPVVTADRLKHSVARANDVFIGSGLSGRLNYVDSFEGFAYQERDLGADFTAAASSAILRQRRDAKRADIVVVVLRESTPADPQMRPCGYSGALAPTFDRSYVVMEEGCLESYTLAHEVGHLMGAAHEAGTHIGPAPFAYAHGHVDIPSASRTVMATPKGCPGCARVALWSSPTLRYSPPPNGRPAGVTGVSEDLRVARERARILATARCR